MFGWFEVTFLLWIAQSDNKLEKSSLIKIAKSKNMSLAKLTFHVFPPISIVYKKGHTS